jgi:hypothetical protein
LAIIIALSALSCARKVVLNPDAVREKNNDDWTVKSQPTQAKR